MTDTNSAVLDEPVAADPDSAPSRWQKEWAEFRDSVPSPGNINWRAVPEFVAVLIAYLAWARYAAVADAGRDEGVMLNTILACIPALLLTQPWRRLSTRLIAVALAAPVSAFAVAAVTPYGFSFALLPATFAWAAMMFLIAASFASTPSRRAIVAIAVIFAGLDQFSQGWLAWWGGGNVFRPMQGTFTWYNPFGAYLAGPTLIAAALAITGTTKIKWIGWVAVPFGVAGVHYSTSRASMLALIGGVVFLLIAALIATKGSRLVLAGKAVALAAVSVTVVKVLGSGWVFRNGPANPLVEAVARTAQADQNLVGHSQDRLFYMQAAIQEFLDRPLVGGGFGSFGPASSEYLPVAKTTLSPFVHNGVLQAFAEGGLLHGLPVLLAFSVAVLMALRGLLTARTAGPSMWLPLGAGAAVCALAGHALIDFDWGWPSVLIMLTVTAALLRDPAADSKTADVNRAVDTPDDTVGKAADDVSSAAPDASTSTGQKRPIRALQPVFVAASVAAVAVFAALSMHSFGQTTVALRKSFFMAQSGLLDQAAEHVTQNSGFLPDPRVAERVLEISTREGIGGTLALPADVTEPAARTHQQIAHIDPAAQSLLLQYTYMAGDEDRAVQEAGRFADRWNEKRPNLVGPYVAMLYEQDRISEARSVVARSVAMLTRPVYNGTNQFPFQHTLGVIAPALNAEKADSAFVRCIATQYNTAYQDFPDAERLAGFPVQGGLPAGSECPTA